jgi:hypothetical protein
MAQLGSSEIYGVLDLKNNKIKNVDTINDVSANDLETVQGSQAKVDAHIGTGGAAHADVIASGASGFMTGADKTKLNNIATSANNYVHPNHSGDITSVADGATTISNGVVTLAKMANLATSTIIGRVTGSTGVPEALTATQVRTIINVADGANNYTHPANHSPSIITQDASNRFVTDTEKSTWNAKSELILGETSITSYRGDRGKIAYDHSQVTHAPSDANNYVHPNHSGDVTSTADGATTYNNTVPVNKGGTGQTTYTNGQLLIGNTTGNTLAKSTLTAGTGITITNGAGAITVTNSSTNATHTGDVTGATALTIASNAVTNTKLADMAVSTIKGRVTAGTGDPEDLTATQVRTILNVADGAEVNQNTFSTVAVSGQPDVVADSKTDTLTFASGTGITITTDATTDTLTITATGGVVPANHATEHVTGGLDVIANAVASGNSGLMSGADKAKLDNVASNANNYVHPANHDPSIITQDSSNRFVTDTEKSTWNGKVNLAGDTMTGKLSLSVASDQASLNIPRNGTTAPTGTVSGDLWYRSNNIYYNDQGTIRALQHTNTTYSAMSVAEGQTGTATTSRTMRADYLKEIIQHHSKGYEAGITAPTNTNMLWIDTN